MRLIMTTLFRLNNHLNPTDLMNQSLDYKIIADGKAQCYQIGRFHCKIG